MSVPVPEASDSDRSPFVSVTVAPTGVTGAGGGGGGAGATGVGGTIRPSQSGSDVPVLPAGSVKVATMLFDSALSVTSACHTPPAPTVAVPKTALEPLS